MDNRCLSFGIIKSTTQSSLTALKQYAALLYEQNKKKIDHLQLINFYPQLEPHLLQSENTFYPIRTLFTSLTSGYNNNIIARKLNKLNRKFRMSNCTSLFGRIKNDILSSSSGEKKIIMAIFGSIISVIIGLITTILIVIVKWRRFTRSSGRSNRNHEEGEAMRELRPRRRSSRRRRN